MNKNKSVKSNISLTSPKGSLIAEINNLRKELKDCKQVKKQGTIVSEKPMRDLFSSMNKKSPQHKCVTSMSNTTKEKFFKASKDDFTSPSKLKMSNLAFETQKSYFEAEKKEKVNKIPSKDTIEQQKQTIEINLNEICVKQKDRKLKIDIEMNKLRKIILKLGPEQIAQQLNYVISLVNGSLREYISRIQILQKNQKADESDQNLLIQRQEQEIEQMTSKIVEYEEELRNLRRELKLKKDQQSELKQTNNLSHVEKNDLRTRAEALDEIVKEFQQKSIFLEEQNKILESKLLKKQEQVLFLQQDVNYLRLQTENHKQQKKEFSQLYEKTLSQLRDFKRTKSIEIQKLQQERDKWEKECKLRRNQSEEISALEQHKITLMKEMSEMRHLCSLKTSQLEEKKTLMHENQRKVIQLESEVYKLKSQVQTLRNQKEFSQFQNEKIKQEFQDLKRYTRNHSSKQKLVFKPNAKVQNEEQNIVNEKDKTVPKFEEKNDFYDGQSQSLVYQNEQKREVYTKKLKQKQDKLRALEDIHSLIKKHRKEMQI